ncbi:hypothetical protein PR048_024021 [Dryococelus australis]|uniref:HTH psq-type domain-containing protein n=1 Tax=Dryococelus australis TaxID=614101 RepID=A0ABQ9GVS8_9NEOP|nr:hypothetical protein PR048_024021 [Dryococelus australis]
MPVVRSVLARLGNISPHFSATSSQPSSTSHSAMLLLSLSEMGHRYAQREARDLATVHGMGDTSVQQARQSATTRSQFPGTGRPNPGFGILVLHTLYVRFIVISLSKPARATYKSLTLSEKIAVIKEVEKGLKKKSEITRGFGILLTT